MGSCIRSELQTLIVAGENGRSRIHSRFKSKRIYLDIPCAVPGPRGVISMRMNRVLSDYITAGKSLARAISMLGCHEPTTGTPSRRLPDDTSQPKPFPKPLVTQRRSGPCVSGTCFVSVSMLYKKHRSRRTMVTFSNLRYPFWPKLFGVSALRTITMLSILEDRY